MIGPKVKAGVTQEDNESGIDIEKTRWIYNSIENPIGTDEENYMGTFNANNEEISTTINTDGIYCLHVLSVDKAGNKIETISEPIEVKQKVDLFNINDTCSEITAGWEKSHEYSPNCCSFTFEPDGMKIHSLITWGEVFVSPVTELDYSSFNKYCYTIDNDRVHDGSQYLSAVGSFRSTYYDVLLGHTKTGVSLPYEFDIPDSHKTSSERLGFIVASQGITVVIHKVWLE